MKREIYINEIRRESERGGLSDTSTNLEQSAPIMSGRFNYATFDSGLSMHSCDAVEQQDSQNQLELPAGLSFNIMFAGHIDYTFADQRLLLSAPARRVQCSAIINPEREMLSRSLHSGMHIKKVNVFVQRQWLAQRCQSEADQAWLTQLFARRQVLSWAAGRPLRQAAQQLLKAPAGDGLSEKMHLEQLTLQLLGPCLEALNKHLPQPGADELHGEIDASLKTAMERELPHCRNLAQLAQRLGMSERTLQRQFKARYQMTAASYFKKRRLEQAKKALIVDKCSVGEAAYVAGYNHSSNFVHAFKREFGLTPAEYSARHKL